MSRNHADALNSFYRIPTPTMTSLRGGMAGINEPRVIKVIPECVKCGKRWPKPYRLEVPTLTAVAGLLVPQRLPNVHDWKIMEQIMVSVCNTAVGCWEECHCGKAYNMTCLNNCVARGVPYARAGDCPCICACKVGCGNRKWYPCRCGKVDIFHNSGCPTGAFKRDSSFKVALARQRMMEGARKRDRLLGGM